VGGGQGNYYLYICNGSMTHSHIYCPFWNLTEMLPTGYHVEPGARFQPGTQSKQPTGKPGTFFCLFICAAGHMDPRGPRWVGWATHEDGFPCIHQHIYIYMYLYVGMYDIYIYIYMYTCTYILPFLEPNRDATDRL
jgi:hypothetical protein